MKYESSYPSFPIFSTPNNNEKKSVSLTNSFHVRHATLMCFLFVTRRMVFTRPKSVWKFVSKTYKIVRQFFKAHWRPLSMKIVQLACSWWQYKPKTVTMANQGKSFMIYWQVRKKKQIPLFPPYFFLWICRFDANEYEFLFFFLASRSNGLFFVGCKNGRIAYGTSVGPWSITGCHWAHCALRSGELNIIFLFLKTEFSLNHFVKPLNRFYRLVSSSMDSLATTT